MKTFILEKTKGLIFISFSIFSIFSLISYSENDPGFGIAGSFDEIANLMGITGAYFSVFMIN